MTTRILTVDDSPTMLDMLAVTLRTAGYDVVQAENGQEGLDVLKTDAADDFQELGRIEWLDDPSRGSRGAASLFLFLR